MPCAWWPSANLTLACFAAPAVLGASDGAECGGADCGSPAPVPPSHPGGLDSGGTARIQEGRRHGAKAEGAGQQAAGVASSES